MRSAAWIIACTLVLHGGAAFSQLTPGSSRSSSMTPDDATTTVVVVRHAEKDTLVLGSDPPLTAAGMLRARVLARMLADARISAIYVTPWQRNRQTAAPLAHTLGESLIVVDPVDETIRRVRKHRGETVLVVGHSNTIPQILSGLTGTAFPDTMPVRYHDLWIATLTPGRPASVVKLRYGGESAFAP